MQSLKAKNKEMIAFCNYFCSPVAERVWHVSLPSPLLHKGTSMGLMDIDHSIPAKDLCQWMCEISILLQQSWIRWGWCCLLLNPTVFYIGCVLGISGSLCFKSEGFVLDPPIHLNSHPTLKNLDTGSLGLWYSEVSHCLRLWCYVDSSSSHGYSTCSPVPC